MPPIPPKKHQPKTPPQTETQPPSVRLALGSGVNVNYQKGGFIEKGIGARESPPPAVRLAHCPGAQGDNVLLGIKGVDALPDGSLPALLVSYVYLDRFLENRHLYRYRDWVMDSGAFSAHNSGTEIKLQDYIDCCKKLLAEDPTLTEVFSLDVIGSWQESLRNVEEMWRQGVPAIPCFHYGEPWSLLLGLAKDYPKIALGGCVGRRDKDKFAGQCFARIWPAKVHGFGFGTEASLMMNPWHSVDATNWEIGPCKYGQWKAFGGQRVSVRGSQQNLRAEVEWYLDLERRARVRWAKQMQQLETLGPSLRLALAHEQSSTSIVTQQRIGTALSQKAPTVRLAHKESGRPNKGLTPQGEGEE